MLSIQHCTRYQSVASQQLVCSYHRKIDRQMISQSSFGNRFGVKANKASPFCSNKPPMIVHRQAGLRRITSSARLSNYVLIVINAINSLGNSQPTVVGGLAPVSDPNNNGVVLANNVTIQAQTLANSLVTVTRTVVLNCSEVPCTSETVEDNLSQTIKAEGTGIEPATPYGALHFQ
jgi:hypothetical protein